MSNIYFEREMEKFFKLYQRVDRQFFREKVEGNFYYQRAASAQNVIMAQEIAADILQNYGYSRSTRPKADNSN